MEFGTSSHAYQYNGEVCRVVVEDVRQLPGLGQQPSIKKTTQDLVKSFTLLQIRYSSID